MKIKWFVETRTKTMPWFLFFSPGVIFFPAYSPFNFIYSSRLGIFNINRDMVNPTTGGITIFERGRKFFELSNHLGNVLVTVSDRKLQMSSGVATVDYYTADVVTATDYYPGGMQMPGRKYQAGSSSYRFGFGGMEKSNEIKGEGNSYTAEFWEYDPRLVRRWNVDPVTKDWESQYAAFSNNPILKIDPHGDSDSIYKTPGGGKIRTESTTAQTFDGSVQQVVTGKNKIYIQPAKGTLRSFSEWNGGGPGETSRFVATFNTKTGEFTGYVWDGDGKTTYESFSKAKREDLENIAKNWDNPFYEHYSNRRDALNNAINLSLSMVVSTPLTKGTEIINKASATNITSNNTSRVLLNSERQLKAKFKHAIDFGVKGNYNKTTAAQFSAALNQHINAARVIQGTYKGQAVIHYLNPITGVNVITKTTGEFISGWKLGTGQLQGLLKDGTLW